MISFLFLLISVSNSINLTPLNGPVCAPVWASAPLSFGSGSITVTMDSGFVNYLIIASYVDYDKVVICDGISLSLLCLR